MSDMWYIALNDLGGNDYASVCDGTAPGVYIPSVPTEGVEFAHYFAFGNNYGAAQAFLDLDTTGLSVTPPVAVLRLPVLTFNRDELQTIRVAAYDWGPSVTLADWRDTAALAALVDAVLSPPLLSSSLATGSFDIPLDPAVINVGGMTRLIVYYAELASATPPTGTNNVLVGSGTNPTTLSASLITTPEVKSPPLGISLPLYTGSLASSPEGAWDLPVAIGDHRYNLEWAKYARATVSAFREARDTSALPGESSLSALAAWKRSRDDWSLGAGQTWADRTLDQFATVARHIEPRLFHTSKGLDPWTIGQLQLQPDTEECIPDSGIIRMLVHGSWIYVMSTDSGTVYRTADPDATSPSTTDITGPTGTMLDMASDGKRIYISTSDGMWIHDTSGTSAVAMVGAAATYSPTLLAWSNGWLFGTLLNEISEIRADGTVNSVYVHPNDGFVFAAIAGTPNFSYFGGQSQDLNEVYRVGVKNDGTLSAAIFSGSLPIGEFLRSMGSYQGLLLLGTTKGIHIAAQGGDGSLALAPVISTSAAVRCMTEESKFVWFGWSQYDSVSTGLGRINLATFSDEQGQISSFASDLMFTGADNVVSVVRFHDHTYFAVANVGLIREKIALSIRSYVAEGTLAMGRFRWGTFEPKVWLGIEVVTEPLQGATDGRIVMEVLKDDHLTTGLGIRGPSNGSTGLGAIYGVGSVNKAMDWYEPTVTLRRGGTDGESSPIVRRVTLRALPVPKTIEQYTLPILMAEKVNDETGEGGEIAYDTSAEYHYLQSLVSHGVPVNFQIAGEQHLVTVREVGWEGVHGLTSNRDGVQGVLMVTLITAEI